MCLIIFANVSFCYRDFHYLCIRKSNKKQEQMKSVRPKKFLGQHFLTDQRVASAIADTVDAAPSLPILEVGPGMGVLTQYLVPKGRELKVVEIDFESVAYLRRTHPELEDQIIEDDFLTLSLERVFGGRPFVLTGNYPYNISSQIFFTERLAAGPGSKTYGILSVLVQAWYDVTYLFTVEPGVFNPPPKVRSAVVRLTRNATTRLGCDERLFRRVVKTTFNQRRKMMRGPLRPFLAQLDAEAGRPAADHTAFLAQPLLTRRPEQLSVAEFVDLTNAVAAEAGLAG